jgi:hypothetical protein
MKRITADSTWNAVRPPSGRGNAGGGRVGAGAAGGRVTDDGSVDGVDAGVEHAQCEFEDSVCGDYERVYHARN